MRVAEDATSPSASPDDGGPPLRTVFWRIVWIALGARVVLQILGMASLAADGQAVWSNALGLWNRWDAPHYLRLAEVGYTSGEPPPDDPLFIVFFPFFPLAVRLVALVVRDLVVSGLLVSLAASVGATWFLYRIVRLDHAHTVAWRAVLLLLTFPTAYFLAAPYTEALFLFAVLGSLYAARTARWPLAGAAGALATGTRVAGVALAPALLYEAFAGGGSGLERLRRLAWASTAALGLAVYLTINQVVHGDPFWFLEVQRFHWFQQAVAPWTSILDAVRGLLAGPPEGHVFILWGRLAGFVVALPLLVLAIRRTRPADALYGWAGLVLLLSASWLISLPRYLLGIYPIFIVGARLTARRRVLLPLLVASTGGQAFLFWRYASGAWTF